MAARIAITYLVITVLWIVVSDALLAYLATAFNLSETSILKIEGAKGIIFMLFTSGLLYFYLKRIFTREQKIRRENRRLFEENPNPMWIYEIASLKFLAVNNAAVTAYGYSREEFLQMTLEDIRPEEDIPKLKAFVLKEEDRFADGTKWRHRNKNGEVFFVDVFSYPTTDFKGKNARLVLAIDVNQRVLAEQQNQRLTQELFKQKNYLDSLLNTPTNFLVIRTDAEGYYRYVNESFCTTFGRRLEQVLGKSYIATTSKEEQEYFMDLINSCFATPGDVIPLRVYMHNKSKEEIIIDWEFVCILDEEGQPKELQGIGQNVTKKVNNLNELAAYKKQLTTIMHTVNDIIWSMRADDFSTAFINQACERMYGYSPDEFYADSNLWFSRIHDEDKAKVQQAIEVLKEKGRNEVKYRIRHKDGSLRYMLDRSVVVKNAEGKTETINGVATDITNLLLAQQEAKENAQRVEQILESITDGFFAVDENWNFTYINKEFERLLYRSREDLLGDNVWKHFPEATSLKFYSEYHRAVKERVSVHFDEYYHPLNVWFKVSAYPTSNGLAVYFQDVTESKRLQKQIFQDKQNMDALINNTKDLIWSVDVENNLLTANEAFKNYIKIATGITVKEGDNMLLPGVSKEVAADWQAKYQRVLRGEQYSIEEATHYGALGIKYVETSFNPIYGKEGEIVGIGCYSRDITQRKLYEMKIEKQNEALREIAWIQSHRVRAPLSNIMSLIWLINDDEPTDPANKEVLQKLYKSAQEMDMIIHNIVQKTNEVDEMKNGTVNP